MNLKEDIKNWMDEDGLVTTDYKPVSLCTTGNGLFYTSLYYIQLVKQGLARKEDYEKFIRTVKACEPRKGNVIFSGVYNRAPCKTEEMNSHDDLTGVAVASWYMKAPMAKDIHCHGYYSKWFIFRWFYNNMSPGTPTKQSWMGRFNDVISTVHWCAEKKPFILRRIVTSVIFALSGIFDRKDCGARILTWLKIEAMNGKSFCCTLGAAFWEWRLRRDFPGGMKEVVSKYFQKEGQPDHALAVHWVD